MSILKRPITPPATLGMVDYQNAEHEQLMKRLRPAQSVEEVMQRIFFSFFVFIFIFTIFGCLADKLLY